jgi:hypothetical protein
MKILSILYIGSFEYGEGSTSWQRMDAIRDLGHDVTALDINTAISLAGEAGTPAWRPAYFSRKEHK